MAKIRVMPEPLANKIAAGEVVERPASAVKELVENAIDAEASQIAVELQGPVCRSIRVVDNGTGMEEDDALLALERHATSKIFSESDLEAIHSLGFRGEALPSIAAVSRFELRSRTRQANVGTRIRVAGGVVTEVSQCGCPPGTQISVRDLFFNQPARRKFLKGERTEFGQVVDTCTRLALARPEIHFSLSQGNRRTHDWPSAVDVRQRMAQLFTARLTESWLPIHYGRGPLSLRGFLSPPELHRSNARMLFTFVNGRAVKDRLLSYALLDAYRTLLPKGRFPLGVLFVELPPEHLDVNVHPTKAEVRFQDSQALCQAVTEAGRDALAAMEARRWRRPLAVVRQQRGAVQVQERLQPLGRESRGVAESSFSTYAAAEHAEVKIVAEGKGETEPGTVQPQVRGLFGELTVIGQLHHAYLLCEAPDGLVLIDQHAAHERVLFESLRTESISASLASQELLVPETIEVTAAEGVWLEEAVAPLRRLGFKLDPFGSHTFVVRAIPAAALRHDPIALLRDLAAEGCRGTSSTEPQVMLEHLLQSMACRLAIKAGQRLRSDEMVALLRQLDEIDHCSTCPHGRPLWWKLTLEEVEQFFGRA
jgi:DNA mismatch repair protein MutL